MSKRRRRDSEEQQGRTWTGPFNSQGGPLNLGDQNAENIYNQNFYGDTEPRSTKSQPLTEEEWREKQIEALDFVQRNARQYQIEALDASDETFEWIWQEKCGGSHNAPGFVEWLRAPASKEVFWIEGNPASGKSTLMNYLAESPKLASLLPTSSDSSWLIVRFFFDFRAGAGIRNDLAGLIRSLLLQIILKTDAENMTFPDLSKDDLLARPKQLRRVCLQVLNACQKNICCLIDGIDEYGGDWQQLRTFLRDITYADAQHTFSIKLCLASRPESIYHIPENIGFRMQEYNTTGIKRFVAEVLSASHPDIRSNDAIQSICTTVAERAQGVFLWAHFAMTEVLSNCAKGSGLDAILARLEQVPERLDAIYDRIFARLNPSELDEIIQIFNLVLDHDGYDYRGELNLYKLLIALKTAQLMATLGSTRTGAELAQIVRISDVRCSDLIMFVQRVKYLSGGLLEHHSVYDEERSSGDESSIDDHPQCLQGHRYIDRLGVSSAGMARLDVTHKTVPAFLSQKRWFGKTSDSYPNLAWPSILASHLRVSEQLQIGTEEYVVALHNDIATFAEQVLNENAFLQPYHGRPIQGALVHHLESLASANSRPYCIHDINDARSLLNGSATFATWALIESFAWLGRSDEENFRINKPELQQQGIMRLHSILAITLSESHVPHEDCMCY